MLGGLIGLAWHNPQVRVRFGPDTAPRIDYVLLSESMTPYVQMWRDEISRRYPDAVAVFVHGDDRHGEWVACPDVLEDAPEVYKLLGVERVVHQLDARPITQVIHDAKARWPGRRLVLITCNPGHYTLNEPGVSYVLDNIWLVPDRMLHARFMQDGDTHGNVFEMVEN